jgi:peroxiredoxin
MRAIRACQITIAALAFAFTLKVNAADTPKVGEKAPDFALKTVDQKSIRLSDLTPNSGVVLLVAAWLAGVSVPLVHGPGSGLDRFRRATFQGKGAHRDGLSGSGRPFESPRAGIPRKKAVAKRLLDPDYAMVNAYGLRWDASNETAYPATFLLDRKGIIRFAKKFSRTHGDRTKALDIIAAIGRFPDQQ